VQEYYHLLFNKWTQATTEEELQQDKGQNTCGFKRKMPDQRPYQAQEHGYSSISQVYCGSD
jgi:hypothetical protein